MSFSIPVYIALGVGVLLVYVLFTQLGYKDKLKKKSDGVYEVKSLPSTLLLFCNVVMRMFSGKPKSSTLTPLRYEMNNVDVTPEHVARYIRVCGFSNTKSVPITYPQLLGFRLQLMLLLDNKFPFKAMGLVHIINRIKQYSALTVGQKVNVVVRCGSELIPHEKGLCFDIICEVYSTDSKNPKLLWESSSVYLSRKKHRTPPNPESLHKSELSKDDMDNMTDLDEAPWKLPGDLGRKYAAVSEDFNPIHMYGFTAALFGFSKGCIAHGLWTSARTMATLDKNGDMSSLCDMSKNQFIDYYTEFKLPIFLPSSVVLMGTKEARSDGSRFVQVVSAKDKAKPHMKGFVKVVKKN